MSIRNEFSVPGNLEIDNNMKCKWESAEFRRCRPPVAALGRGEQQMSIRNEFSVLGNLKIDTIYVECMRISRIS